MTCKNVGSTVLVSAFHVMGWVGLGWVHKLMSWAGLREEKWTHVHLCDGSMFIEQRR